LVQHFARGLAGDHDAVNLLDAEPRVGQPVREFTVVGQEHQPGALLVEPADRVNPLGDLGEDVDDQGLARRVAVGRDVAFGLVDGVVNVSFGVDLLAVERDLLAARVDAGAEFADDLVVDRDPALEDEFLARPPRADAGVGQDLLKTFEPVVLPLRRAGPRAPAS